LYVRHRGNKQVRETVTFEIFPGIKFHEQKKQNHSQCFLQVKTGTNV